MVLSKYSSDAEDYIWGEVEGEKRGVEVKMGRG